jgi:hypothetical protein
VRVFVLASVALLFTAAAARAGMRVVDLDGRAVAPLETPERVRANAVIFTTTDCPIANRYAPEIQRLSDRFRAQGIRFWLVYVNPSEPPGVIRTHLQNFGLSVPALRDLQHDLVRQLGITVTPEVAIVDRGGISVYRGRSQPRTISRTR